MINTKYSQKYPRVYLCRLVKEITPVANELRQKEIEGATNHVVKLEKYTAWKLLEFAIHNAFGVDFNTLNPTKNAKGKWVCDDVYFSISHSKGVCAVAVDVAPVGIDVQLCELDRFDAKLANRIATQKEWQQLADQTLWKACPQTQNATCMVEKDKILCLWCKKEALFKKLDLQSFAPSKLDTTTQNFVSLNTVVDNQNYHVAVATDSKQVDIKFVIIE